MPGGIGSSAIGRPLPFLRPALRVGPLEIGVVPGVVDLEKDPLRPLVVVGIGRIDLAVPVVREAERLDLAAEGVDVGLGGDPGVRIGLDRVLLGGQAEGVPAHRVQHVEPAHSLVAAQDVGGRVALGMADVQARPAGIGKHVEDVELGPGRIEIDRAERLVPFPFGLPLGLDALRVIRRHAGTLRPRPPRPLSTARGRWLLR